MRKRNYLIVIQFAILIYCLFFLAGRLDTYAWFTSEIKATGQITNATTEDLLSISTSDIIYHTNCEISQELIIKNISDIKIPIKLVNNEQLLDPGESFKTSVKQTISCEKTEVGYHLIGLNHYIDEMIHVPLNQEKLLATVEKKKEKEEEKEIKKDQSNDNASEKNNEESTQAESDEPTMPAEEEKSDQTENDPAVKGQLDQPVIPNEEVDLSSDDGNKQSEEIEVHSK
ncbi:hypothetical protein HP456_17810 [Bacillus haikouensis]|jgi:hypothetical protein|uniref:hypothetical protein n=1 Tax=Bacillus haikouensis TaxID=1510468 RepID=UPI001556CE33|nr:hypothetical protein [Bacillus haikouensis]NQD67768.1 hypothetical protein [Bacillus haikouensis]